MKNKLSLILVMLVFGAVACNLSGTAAEPVDAVGTSVGATLAAEGILLEDQVVIGEEENLLPYSLYYLSEAADGLVQVWRLEKDGTTQTQLTFEPEAVQDYAVNPIDGSLAYIVASQLYWADVDGAGRRLLVEGSLPEGDGAEAYRSRVSSPVWSNDGATLVYGENGVNFMDMTSGEARKLVENEIEDLGDGLILPRRVYFPEMFSPDGSKLLVNVGFHEGGTLAILDPATSEVVFFGEGIVCCHPAWANDGNVVVASPYIGMIVPGLWRYDAASGAETILVPSNSEDGTFNFAGWPTQLPNGDFQYFYASTAEFPEGDPNFSLVRTLADGSTDRTLLRPETFNDFRETLWAPDGSFIIVVQPEFGDTPSNQGPLLMISTADLPIFPLGVNGSGLAWGP